MSELYSPRYEISAIGGTMWRAELIDSSLTPRELSEINRRAASFSAGDLDNDGQWIGDDDDVLAAAMDIIPCPIDPDTPVYVDGVRVR